MTTIIDNRGEKPANIFDELEVGEFYEDRDGYLCLKVSHSNCLCNANGRWIFSNENPEATVSPLLATITIERS